MGQLPGGEQLTDLLFSLCRLPNLGTPGIREAVARACGLGLASLLDAPGRRLTPEELQQLAMLNVPGEDENSRLETASVSASDAIERLETCCHHLLAVLQEHHFSLSAVEQAITTCFLSTPSSDVSDVCAVLSFVCTEILPRLMQTGDEIRHVLKALDGEYVPAGPSGSPTRGMVHVLPTGRNFYTLDPRALPSQSAWEVGSQLAKALIDRHMHETGRYPESVGLSIWGTSALRTQGDDIAQVFALLGVRPQWQHENRRLRGIEVIPLHELVGQLASGLQTEGNSERLKGNSERGESGRWEGQ